MTIMPQFSSTWAPELCICGQQVRIILEVLKLCWLTLKFSGFMCS